MVVRLSVVSTATCVPFMVTVPERLDVPSRAATPVEELEKASLWAPPVTWFLMLVPAPLNPRLPRASVAEPFRRLIPEAPVLLLVSSSRQVVRRVLDHGCRYARRRGARIGAVDIGGYILQGVGSRDIYCFTVYQDRPRDIERAALRRKLGGGEFFRMCYVADHYLMGAWGCRRRRCGGKER